MEPIRVLAAVIERDNRFLLCKRPMDKRHGGLWEFPGGKIEAFETDLAAAQRELKEELALQATRVSPPEYSIQDAGSPFLIQFVRVDVLGEPICLEHSELAWVDGEHLLSYELAPSDRAFVEFLASRDSGNK
jgi:mutator protein MutT